MSRPTQYVPIALCLRLSLRQQGLNPPPPPLGLPSEHVICAQKNAIMWLVDARKTSLTGVQNSKKNRLAATRLGHRLCIEKRHHAVSRCQENITYGGSKQHKKNRLAASRLVDDVQNSQKKIGSPLRGSWTMLRIVVGSNPPPPWKKARSAPEYTNENTISFSYFENLIFISFWLSWMNLYNVRQMIIIQPNVKNLTAFLSF